MKKVLFLLTSALLSFTSFSQTWTRVEEATKYKGTVINFVGVVTHVERVTDKQHYITVRGLGGRDAYPSLTLVLKNSNRSKVTEIPETSYLNQYVQVTGKVEIYKNKPQIVVSNKDQISIAQEPRKQDCCEPF